MKQISVIKTTGKENLYSTTTKNSAPDFSVYVMSIFANKGGGANPPF